MKLFIKKTNRLYTKLNHKHNLRISNEKERFLLVLLGFSLNKLISYKTKMYINFEEINNRHT